MSLLFFINGDGPVRLDELLAANGDDTEVCEWARGAQPGDVFGGGAGGEVECREIVDLTPNAIRAALIGATTRQRLGTLHTQVVGYDPFQDDPSATEEDVRSLLSGDADEMELEQSHPESAAA